MFDQFYSITEVIQIYGMIVFLLTCVDGLRGPEVLEKILFTFLHVEYCSVNVRGVYTYIVRVGTA